MEVKIGIPGSKASYTTLKANNNDIDTHLRIMEVPQSSPKRYFIVGRPDNNSNYRYLTRKSTIANFRCYWKDANEKNFDKLVYPDDDNSKWYITPVSNSGNNGLQNMSDYDGSLGYV